MIHGSDNMLRAQALEAYEAITTLDRHGETIRLILAEVSLLAEKYRCVRRHDVPHVKEIAGLLDLLWQEIEMAGVKKPVDVSAFPQIEAGARA